ncbi:DUF488 family protein [Streptomyces sannanensis]|uniref:DUF488 family protein n=1 Tax=Streptomyces sannanensis TaxID=285536 RepID=A0ABP6SCH8_9ACTN
MTKPKPRIRIRRVYEPPYPDDGTRILVDRLWPRGLSKDAAAVDEWPKDVTPSNELRQWFHSPSGGPEEFRRRYEAELDGPGAAAALDRLRTLVRSGPVTLLTAVKDPEHSHASVLARVLSEPDRPADTT